MKRIPISLLSFLLTVHCFAAGGVIEYTTTPGAVASKTFTLSVNGKEIFVEKFKDVSYARFAFTDKVNLEVKVAKEFDGYVLSPVSYSIASQKKGNTIAFELNQS